MAKEKKQPVKQKKTGNPSGNTNFSFLIIDKHSQYKENITKIISDLKNEFTKNTEFIIVHYKSDEKTISESSFTNSATVKHVHVNDNITKPEMIKEGIQNASNELITIIDPEQINNEFDINTYFNIRSKKLDTGKIIQFVYENGKNKTRYNPANQIIFPKTIAEYLFDKTSIKSKNYFKEIRYKVKKINIPKEEISIAQPVPFDKSSIKIPAPLNLLLNIKLFLFWYIYLPLIELKSKPHQRYPFITEPGINRFLFTTIAFILFILMPFLSLNSSISGDEFAQLRQVKNYYNFYSTMGEDTSYINQKPAFAYGMSFDLITYTINEWFNIENIFKSRHIFNSLCGWATILFSGLLALIFGGWRTGIFTMLLLFFTPRFLGHSFNNPKDIPFAMTYIFTIYFIIRMLKDFPRHNIKNYIWIAVGIGAAISVRIGGLLLIAYLFLFSGLYYLSRVKLNSLFSKVHRNTLNKLLFNAVVFSVIGYFLGLILWPYGLTNPVKHPLNSLEIMTHFTTSLRQLFEGNIYWSDYLPWYYIPKYILITTPFVILIGFLLYFVFIRKKIIQSEYLYSFFLVFSFAFPVFYIIYKGSNVYGGWRHALFIWPTFVIATSLGYEKLLRIIRNKRFQYLIYGIMAALALKPAIHIIKHHPYEYIYFNKFVGGVDKAYGDYEMDYYGHSLKPAAKWLINNIIEDKLDEIDPNDKMIIRTNFTKELRHYMRKYNNKVKVHYCRYYERGNFDWDYAIFVNTYLNPYQQKHGIWPPGKTIHTINIDDAIICAVQERKTTLDLKGFQALQNNNPQQAIINLKKAIKITPHNEAAYINLCRAYLKIGMHNQAIKTAYKCLKFYPDYDQVLNLLGIAYLQKNELNNALATFNKLKKVNKKYSSAYYYMGIIYMRQSQPYNAMKYLKQCIESNQQYKPAYYAMAEILKKLGKPEQAKQYLQVANSF